jgi:elongation factor Ts
MMECKKALVETKGDLELAIEQMRKSGLAKADKKSGRTAADGSIGVKVSADGKNSAMVEINSETDFVVKGDDFNAFVNDIVDTLLDADIEGLDQLLEMKLPNGSTVDETRRALIAKLGENINVRRFAKFSSSEGSIGCYRHGDRIGVLVELSGNNSDLSKDLAMHIAASNPICVADKDVASELVEKEKEIFTAQAKESGKSAEIIEKMIAGKVRKYLAEVTLLGQAFIKDPDVSVGKLVGNHDATVIRFTRFEVGEGIEKKEENFANEVMAQVAATK